MGKSRRPRDCKKTFTMSSNSMKSLIKIKMGRVRWRSRTLTIRSISILKTISILLMLLVLMCLRWRKSNKIKKAYWSRRKILIPLWVRTRLKSKICWKVALLNKAMGWSNKALITSKIASITRLNPLSHTWMVMVLTQVKMIQPVMTLKQENTSKKNTSQMIKWGETNVWSNNCRCLLKYLKNE